MSYYECDSGCGRYKPHPMLKSCPSCTAFNELPAQLKRKRITDKIKKWIKYGYWGGSEPKLTQCEYEWIIKELE